MLPLEPPQLRITREGFKCDTEAQKKKKRQETQNSLFTFSEKEGPRAKTCPGPGVKPGLAWCPGLLPLCGVLTLTPTLPPQGILLSAPPPTESKRLQGGDHKSPSLMSL